MSDHSVGKKKSRDDTASARLPSAKHNLSTDHASSAPSPEAKARKSGDAMRKLQIVHLVRKLLPQDIKSAEHQKLCEDIQSSTHPTAMLGFSELFKLPMEAPKVTFSGLWAACDVMFALNGSQGIHQLFSAAPVDAVTGEAVLNALSAFEPGSLGSTFHLSQVVPGLRGCYNYEAVASFLLSAASIEPELLRGSNLGEPVGDHWPLLAVLPPPLERSVVLLVYVAQNTPDRSFDALGAAFRALLVGVETFVHQVSALPPSLVNTVIKAVSKAAVAYDMFFHIPNPQLSRMLATLPSDTARTLLEAWIANPVRPFNRILDLLQTCDEQTGDLLWSKLLVDLFSDSARRFGALLDFYRPEFDTNSASNASSNTNSNAANNSATNSATNSAANSTANSTANSGSNPLQEDEPSTPKYSLRIAGAIAQLVQTLEPPKDRASRPEQIQLLQFQLVQTHPRLINYGQGHDAAILANAENAAFAKDVEDEMKLCFQKMYEQQYDIHEVIAMLERLKHSDTLRDQDLFACMVHSLFDEYQFFAQYPVKALATTAVLFGSLVHFRLVEGVSLAIALKFVLDALRQDVDSNMFRFGLQALVELRQRLEEFPKYCRVLLNITGLQQQPQFYAQIRAIADPEAEEERVDLFKSINFTITPDEGLHPPGFGGGVETTKEVEDALKRVSLLVNNLTAKNLNDKAPDALREIDFVGPTRFAKVLVSRATKEVNYQEIYAALIDLLPIEVNQFCVNVVVAQIAHILNASDALSTEKRLSLKNLGQFLGMLTVARDRPLLFGQLHPKLLLAEGVRYEKLPAVLPLVAKILVQTATSKAFCSTSPWVTGILSVLSELYAFGNLKLTMKFEIEVLGKAIGVNITKVEPSFYIRNESQQVEDLNAIIATLGGPAVGNGLLVSAAPPSLAAQQLASARGTQVPMPMSLNHGMAGPPGLVPNQSNVPTGLGNPANPLGVLNAGNVAASAGSGANPNLVMGNATAALFGQVDGNSGVPLVGTTEFVTHPGLRQLLDVARSKTLVDVLLPVIDRAVSIASFTAKELVLKDLAREPDEAMLQAAAHSQALVLASSMAIVTAKEPFVEALTHNLRALLMAQGHGESQLLVDQTQLAARETMDSLVSLIESVAREKVIAEVDEALLPHYQVRHLARTQNRPFEPENYQEPPISLPELLQVRPGGLLPEQMAVYDGFAPKPAVPFGEASALAETTLADPAALPPNMGMGGVEDPYSVVDIVYREIHADFMNQLQKLVVATKSPPLSEKRLGDLQINDEVLVTLSSLVEYVQNSVREIEPLALRFSHVVVQTLFGPESTDSVLCRECLCYLLGDLCRVSSVTAKEVVLWLLYADDPKKYNANVIGTLLRSRLVTPTEIDAMLTKDIAELEQKPSVLPYAVRLLLDALIGPEAYCLRSDFAGTILAISRLDAEQYPAAGILVTSLTETRGQGVGNEGHVFAEWTRLMQHHATATSPMLLHAFVRDLHSLGWGTSPNQLVHFLRTAVTVSVQSYHQSQSFVGVDAVASLVTTLLQTVKNSEESAKMLLMVITMVVAEHHDRAVGAAASPSGETKTNSEEGSKPEGPAGGGNIKPAGKTSAAGTKDSPATPASPKAESSNDPEEQRFDPLVYYRLFSSIATQLPKEYVGVLAQNVLALQPLAFPAFASQWMTLMSHRFLMGRLLDDREHWPQLFTLVRALLAFLRYTWLSPVMSTDIKNFVYHGTERICLVILHDAPEFFVRYADEITALLISELVQLRNLVLCAFPEGVALPHPVDMQDAEYSDIDSGMLEAVQDAKELLTERKVMKLVENACQVRPQLTPQIVMAVQTALAYSKPVEDRGVDFSSVSVSMRAYNALCTYVAHLYTHSPAASNKVEDSGAAQFCGRMLLTLSRENRYAFVSAIANHLRYPEKHTYFFSRFLLALFTPFGERMFKDGTVEARHVVTRVLLERLMAHRAHPWGLMATFAELLKSSQYTFWNMPFIKSSTELSELFSTLYAHISQEAAAE